MQLLKKFYSEKIIMWFYILFPIVEILTSFVIVNTTTSFTPGMIYKTLFILYGVIYLVFIDKNSRKLNLAILGLFAIATITHTVITIEGYTLGNLITKANQLLKYICFPISLWFLYRYVSNGNKLHMKTFVICAAIYGGSMILARVTGTAMPTYDSKPNGGHSGWIYSGNELSSLLAIFYPVVIYYLAKNKDKLGVLSLLVSTYALLAIGTKTAFLSLFIYMIGFLIWGIIKHKEEIGKSFIFIVVILAIVTAACVPCSPTLTEINERINKATQTSSGEGSEKPTTEEVMDNLIFNGRSEYLAMQMEKYQKASVPEKLFGLSGDEKPVYDNGEYMIIERDFHDLTITYGIIGIIIYMIPIIIILVNFFKRFIKFFKDEFNTYNFVIGITLLTLLGIAFIVGHVLLVPTVAIFLSALFANLANLEESK